MISVIRTRIAGGIEQLVRQDEKGWFASLLVQSLRKIARRSFAVPLIGWYVGSKLKRLGSPALDTDSIRLMVLNEERYRPDLEALAARQDVELFALPSAVQHLVNAIWVTELREIATADPDAYLHNKQSDVKRVRRQLHIFLTRLIGRLAAKYRLDGMTSCTFYYRQDREWESAGHEIGIPFFALHKENMKDPVTHPSTIARYRRKAFRFQGNRLFLVNQLEKKVILQAGCAEEAQISVVGALRMDTLYRRLVSRGKRKNRRRIVLFSTHHCLGLLELPGVNGVFNPRRDAGFVRHFDLIHGTLARFAMNHPDIECVIKSKWLGVWHEEIVAAIHRIAGVMPDTIPNLMITASIPAQDLIDEAAVVVGMNSTTLLEAKLAGVPVVVPLFEEAAEKYFETNVYFQKYLDSFALARSAEQLYEMLGQAAEGKLPAQKEMPCEMVEDYLGFFDGRVAERVVEVMKKDIERARLQRTRGKS